MGVKLFDLDTADEVAAAMVIPPEDPKTNCEGGTLLQWLERATTNQDNKEA